MLQFRLLRADEIECRISSVGPWGVQLLLYKDARADMNLMDECVGPENWQRKHEVINGNLFCSVGIRVIREDGSAEWIWRQDVGTESNTEKEKGQSSDSFKRACTCFGAGRELYSAPTIFVKPNNLKTLKQDNNKWTCKDFFTVTDIQYDGRKIRSVQILNTKTGALMNFGDEKTVTADRETDKVIDNQFLKEHGRERITSKEISELEAVCGTGKISREDILASCNKSSLNDVTYFQFYTIMNRYAA